MPKNTIKPKFIFNEMELSTIPEGVFKQKNLLKVKLIRNNIKNIPKDIENLSRLETFDISNNNIIHTYTKLFELQKLKILIINNNRLNNLPRQIGKLKKLKKLQLANNSLKSLPDEIEQLENLTELNISYNKFKQFPKQIFNLKSLKSIWIGGNYFETFPMEELLEKLPHLLRVYTFSNIQYHDKLSVNSNYIRLSSIKGNIYDVLKQKPKDIIINPTNEIVENLTSHIIQGNINNFFNLLNDNTELFKKKELVSLYNLQAQWNNLERRIHENIISIDQQVLQKNQITNGLLRIIMAE
nr:leucine-rich repeat domain-containing protein [uncultured Psychroserpens sp.]